MNTASISIDELQNCLQYFSYRIVKVWCLQWITSCWANKTQTLPGSRRRDARDAREVRQARTLSRPGAEPPWLSPSNVWWLQGDLTITKMMMYRWFNHRTHGDLLLIEAWNIVILWWLWPSKGDSMVSYRTILKTHGFPLQKWSANGGPVEIVRRRLQEGKYEEQRFQMVSLRNISEKILFI